MLHITVSDSFPDDLAGRIASPVLFAIAKTARRSNL
jgi:hypothetical protein